jgi:hypothetical protein
MVGAGCGSEVGPAVRIRFAPAASLERTRRPDRLEVIDGQLVWQIERELIEEDARPDILYVRGITCRRPYVKGLISMVNSIYNGSRFEGVWLAN